MKNGVHQVMSPMKRRTPAMTLLGSRCQIQMRRAG
jgi:hypothetical protein